VFANKAILVTSNSIPPPLDTCILQLQPMGESLRIVWPSSGLKLASPATGDGAASVNENMQIIQWKNIDKTYPVYSREISIICQISIENITLIKGIASLQQISGKLQNI